jgi:hypothetical protein
VTVGERAQGRPLSAPGSGAGNGVAARRNSFRRGHVSVGLDEKQRCRVFGGKAVGRDRHYGMSRARAVFLVNDGVEMRSPPPLTFFVDITLTSRKNSRRRLG